MGEGVGADLPRDLHLPLGDQRARDRRAEEVATSVDRTRAEHRPDVLGDESLAEVLDVALLGARGECLCPHTLEFFTLADIAGNTDNASVVVLAQPWYDDRGIESARIGEDDGRRIHERSGTWSGIYKYSRCTHI